MSVSFNEVMKLSAQSASIKQEDYKRNLLASSIYEGAHTFSAVNAVSLIFFLDSLLFYAIARDVCKSQG